MSCVIFQRRRRATSSTPLPILISISLGYGPTAGGDTVVLRGSGFTGASAVTIGGAACTSVVVDSDTQITCDTPAGTAGAKDVVVTAPGGQNTLAGGYTYQAGPDLSGASLDVTSGSYVGGMIVSVTGASRVEEGATMTLGGVAHPIIRTSSTAFVFVAKAIAIGSVGAKNLTVTNPDGQSDTKNSAFTYTNRNPLEFTLISSIVSIKGNHPAGTIFRGVDGSNNHVCYIGVDGDGDLYVTGRVDFTKLSGFLDSATYQFADITGTSNLVLDSNGLTFDVAAGGGVYWKGFKASWNMHNVKAKCAITAGNATPVVEDSFWAGWITDPTVAYNLAAGGIAHNGSAFRQMRFSGSNAAAPTRTAAANNLANTPGTSPENWLLGYYGNMGEDGSESMVAFGNKLNTGWLPVDDGSSSVVTAVSGFASTGKIWHPCFGARSASTGTATLRVTEAIFNFGVIT